MPTASETSLDESRRWTRLAERWLQGRNPTIWADRPPTEKSVVVFFDPVEDLELKARRGGFHLRDNSLPELAGFAADLAATEARHWESGSADLATEAYERRRFLVGDRVIHWAVPWLDAVGRCYPSTRGDAHSDRDFLLGLGDTMRLQPLLAGREGLVIEGEDSYGTVEMIGEVERWLDSLWSGHLILDATWASLRSEGAEPTGTELALLYEVAASRWMGVSARHPGTAQLWADLAARASRTSEALAARAG